EDQRDLLHDLWRRPFREEPPQQQEARVLAVDLTGVDAALEQHHRPRPAAQPRRVEYSVAGHHQRLQRPALRGHAEALAARPLPLRRGEGGAEFFYFYVAACALEAAALRRRRKRRRRRTLRNAAEQRGKQRPEARTS